MHEDEIWKSIQKDLLKTPPESMRSEDFVSSVMARLPEKRSIFEGLWWKVPVLAMGTAALLFVSAEIQETAPSTETLLCATRPDAQAIIQASYQNGDDLLTLSSEEISL